jgi:hypothetical protein
MSDERYIRKVRLLWLLATFLVSVAGRAGIYVWHEEISPSRHAVGGWVLVTGVSTLLWLILLGDLAVNQWRRWRRP